MADERTESQGFYEMLWDCEFCSTKGLLGKSQRHCPECGAKQDADKRYFPKEGEQIKIEGHKYEGSDRYCPACKNPQSAAGKNCTNCGSPMDGSAEVKGVATPVAPPPKKKSRLWILIVLLVVIGGIVGIVFGVKHCNRTKDAGGKVVAHAWERSIPIQEYGDVRESRWRNELPPDAREVICHREERSTRKIPDGETCKDEKHDRKDGTFEVVKKCTPKFRSEPVEDDKCNFVVRKWKEIDKKTATGTGMTLTDPPGLTPSNVPEVPGARRPGPKQDTLYLELDVVGADPQKQRCDVKEAEWKKYADGAAVMVQVRAKDGKIDCEASF